MTGVFFAGTVQNLKNEKRPSLGGFYYNICNDVNWIVVTGNHTFIYILYIFYLHEFFMMYSISTIDHQPLQTSLLQQCCNLYIYPPGGSLDICSLTCFHVSAYAEMIGEFLMFILFTSGCSEYVDFFCYVSAEVGGGHLSNQSMASLWRSQYTHGHLHHFCTAHVLQPLHKKV